MKLQNTRFERTLPGILKYQPTKVRKDRTKSLGIDTGKEYKNRGDSKPTQSAGQCCYNSYKVLGSREPHQVLCMCRT